jgi:hypothetical protein
MLLGKSYAQAGQNAVAMEEMRKGLRILEQSTGTNSVKFLAAEIAYSEVPDRSGAHTEATRLKDSAVQGLAKLNPDACPRCESASWPSTDVTGSFSHRRHRNRQLIHQIGSL